MRTGTKARVVLLALAVTTAQRTTRCLADTFPDARTLVQGVESARLQIPTSRLHTRLVFTDPLRSVTNEFLIEFDGEKRRFFASGKGARARSLFDGSQVALYDGAREVTLRDLGDDTADPLFDPRILGLCPFYAWSASISLALPYRTASMLETVGREQVLDKTAWHVRLITQSPTTYQVDLWIDEKSPFRVLRYEVSESGYRQVAISYYNEENYLSLPSRVESVSYDGKGEVRFTLLHEILKAELNVALPHNAWTLAGLDLPVRTTVSDRRTHTILGHWDGRQVRPGVGSDVRGDSLSGNVNRVRAVRVFLVSFFVVTVAGGCLLLIRMRRRPR